MSRRQLNCTEVQKTARDKILTEIVFNRLFGNPKSSESIVPPGLEIISPDLRIPGTPLRFVPG